MSKIKCSHCRLEFDESIMIKEEGKPNLYFCCNGCQGVYHLLKEDGLDSFYDKVGNEKIAPPLKVGQDSSNFDMESFAQRYIKSTKEGFSEVNLMIEGIHCSACIWLNEKVLNNSDGVVDASINFTNNRAKIIWDEDKIKLSKIIDKIRNIGYNAYPYDNVESERKATSNKRDYFLRMSIAIFASMNIMMIGIAKYAGFFSGMREETLKLIHIAEFIFATPVLFYSGWIFFRGAYYGLKNRIINMDFLVSSGATITYIYSLFVLFGGKGDSYFDSVAMIITFVLVGKYLEVLGKKSAMDTMDKIRSQIPLEATVVKDNVKKIVPLDGVMVGDIIETKMGEKVAVDGELISQEGVFDESNISGESLPVEKKMGDKIYGGTINVGQIVRYRATKNYANSTLNNILTLLEDSLSSKPKIEEDANRISKYFSVTILILSLFTFLGWYLYDGEFEKSLLISISVIVIACPCALALATPIASLIGISLGAKRGIIFKEAKFIETMAKISTIVFDKTGTLTEGKLTVKSQSNDIDKKKLSLLYGLVDSSTHPVSRAIKIYLNKKYHEIERVELEKVEQIHARGLRGIYEKSLILGGNEKLLLDNGIHLSTESDYTSYHFAMDDEVIVSFELEDRIREDAIETIKYLKRNNIEVFMATGDNIRVATRVTKEIGIENFESDMTPIDKGNYIEKMRKENRMVVMVGDGVNDALALSKADIAIAMGGGADISLSVGDIVILNDSLKGVKESFIISRRTYRFIKQNLGLSLIYNILTIPVAIGGFVIPLVAALSMSLSSLLVVGNSMRIKLKKVS